MADYKQLASTIIVNVGGSENVRSVVHCKSRLRFVLRDTTKADIAVLRKTKGIMQVMNKDGQCQIVIGPDVPKVYEEIMAQGSFSDEPAAPVKSKKPDKKPGSSRSSGRKLGPVIALALICVLFKVFTVLNGTMNWIPDASVASIMGTASNVMLGVGAALVLLAALSGGKKSKRSKEPQPEDSPAESAAADEPEAEGKNGVLFAPVVGEVIDLSEVPDEAFSSGVLGKGIAIIPTMGDICAPCDGEITALPSSCHAVGITTADGAEVIIHVGIDTVSMNGEGFKAMVKEGDRVKKGQLLLKANIRLIKARNLSTITPVVITNSDNYEITVVEPGTVTAKNTEIISYK